MTCSLLLPVLLYATLAWRRLSILKRVALGALIVLSVLILLLVVTASLLAMLAPEDDSSNALLSAGQAGKPLQGVAFVKLYFDRLQGAT